MLIYAAFNLGDSFIIAGVITNLVSNTNIILVDNKLSYVA